MKIEDCKKFAEKHSEFFDYAQKIVDECNALPEKMRVVEDEISNCYHALELIDLDGPSTMKVVKRLKVYLRERRRMKEEHSFYQMMEHTANRAVEQRKEFEKRSEARLKEYKQLAKKALELAHGKN